jgi:membrane-associated phospholipid phosphatase
VFLSWIGTDGIVFLVVAAALAVLWRRPWLLVLVLASDLVAELLSYGMRDWIGRRRPPLVYPEPKPLVHVPHSGSFPSGHATMAFACATVVAWQVPRLAFPAFVLAGAIAWSRVYNGVHWPLDVLGGAALGIVIATALLMLVRVRPRSPRETPAG